MPASPTSKLFEKQFGILINDINKLVANTSSSASTELDQLVKQYSLRHMLPDDTIIKSYDKYFRSPYGTYIQNKNADFFLNINVNDIIEDTSKYNDTVSVLATIFKDLWSTGLDDDTKNMIWMRLQILNKICEKWNNE